MSCQRNSIVRGPSTGLAGSRPSLRPASAAGRRPVRSPASRLAVAAKRGLASLDQRDRAAAHILLFGPRAAEVVGQRDVGHDRGQLGPQCRLDPEALLRVADLDVEPAGLDLRRQLEGELAVVEPGRRRELLAELGDSLARAATPSRARELHGDGERLAVRDDETPGQGFAPRRTYTGACAPRGRAAAPRRSRPRPGTIASKPSANAQRARANSQTQRRWRGCGHRVAEVSTLGSSATWRIAASQRRRDRACSLSLCSSSMTPSSWSPIRGCLRPSSRASWSGRRCSPDPAIQRQRARSRTPINAATKRHGAEPARRFPGTVDGEDHQIGDQDAEAGRRDGLDHLDRPDPTAEVIELCPQCLGQLQPVCAVRAMLMVTSRTRKRGAKCLTACPPSNYIRPSTFLPTQKTPSRA